MRLTLRDYQTDALARVEAAHERGVRRPMIVAATGLGKTVMFCALAERRRARTLIIAHRDELIEQAAAKVREVWPEAHVGVVKGERDEHDAQVVVASIQTLSRQARLDRLVSPPDSILRPAPDRFGLVVVDEAHHTAAATYRRVIDALGAGTEDGPMLLGVTATPDRGDGKGLDDLFDEVVASYDILWGIGAGYLSDVRGVAVRLAEMDLSSVKVSRGDYDQGQAGAAMSAAHGPALIVKAWREHAAGRRTLVFTPTVAVAEEVSSAFRHDGIAAEFVHGGTPLDERRAILSSFRRGDIDVVANCAVLTEGYDEPRVDCIIVARPTRSRALYTQMVGRGTRRHPDKTDCLVLDVVGASEEHSLVTIPSLFGIDKPEFAARLRDGAATVSETVEAFQQEQVRIGRLRAEEVDLFHKVRSEGVAWVPSRAPSKFSGLRRYVRPLGGKGSTMFVLQQIEQGEDRYVAGVIERGGAKQVLIFDARLETAQAVAEEAIRRRGFGHSAVVRADAPWRTRKPSRKMLEAARRWRIEVDPKWNAGEVSDAITAKAGYAAARR